MAIRTALITAEQVQKLLDRQESHFHDVKAIEISPSKLTKTVSAFANADGGELYIGIDEDRISGSHKWRGFETIEKANGHIQALESLFPLGRHFAYTFLSCPNFSGAILHLEVQKTPDIKKASDGNVYLRRGAQSLPVDTEEKLTRLRLDKGIISFETETVHADAIEIANSEIVIRFLLNVIPTAEPEPWLRKQQLIVNGKPTVAGVILFADVPQAILPKRCAIKIYRYKTKDIEGTRDTLAFDPITIDGCAYDQISSSVTQTVEIIESIPIAADK